MKKHRVIFQPSGRRGEVPDGTDLLDAARNLGVDIESICGGKGTCGKCKVRVEEGFFEKDSMDSRMEHLSPLTDVERKFLKPSDGPGMRLACAARAHGDVKIFVPEKSRAGKQVVRKAARELNIAIDPAVKKYFVELARPSLHEPITGDLEKLRGALSENYGLDGKNLSIDFPVLKDLQDTIRKGNWCVTVSVWKGREIIKLEPGFIETAYGLAVDVGTTTVVGYLTDLSTGKVVATESMMNPQVPYGEDVMSRITYAMTNPDGVRRMQGAIIEGLNEIISNIITNARNSGALNSEALGGGETVVDMTIVFNTAMHHIFLGFNPEHIGRSPFIPAIQHGLDIKARDLGIKINPGSYIYVLPIEAGFVGADNVGVLIAMEPYNIDEKVLIIDIGTNGELLLGNRERVCSTSCATGPAFEGAQIKMGMRAAPGAIEKVRIDPATKEPLYKVIGKEQWQTEIEKVDAKGICGSGIIDAIAWMYKAGIIDKSGRFDMTAETPRIRKDHEGKPEYVLAWARETSIGADITITQADVRALQLAKGALYAGAKLMMHKMGIEKLDKVLLAGAFGSYIDKESAMTLGMFPDCEIENVYAVGNAAGDGARMALVSNLKRQEAEERARWVEFVEIAIEPAFEKEFMQAMHLPHMKDRFPNLKKLIEKESPHVAIKG